MCQKCSEGTKYDKDHHECLTTEGNIATQVPTLEKMAAGIFSWFLLSSTFKLIVLFFHEKIFRRL